MIARQEELNFAPGARFLYSNSGYFLLSQVVARATGKSLRQTADELIFAPLGMHRTHFHDAHRELVRHRAEGYAPNGAGGFRISRTTLEMVGDGGVFTNVEDLLLWDRNFYEPKVGGRKFLALLHATGTLADGKKLDYAAGLRVSKYRGLRTVSHGGAFVGYRADMLRFPEHKVTIVCLANVNSANPSRLCRAVADRVLDGQLEAAANAKGTRNKSTGDAEKAAPVELTAEQQRALAGRYYSAELDAAWHLAVDEGRLRVRLGRDTDEELTAIGPDEMTAVGVRLRFERGADGTVTGFRAQAGRVRNLLFVRQPD